MERYVIHEGFLIERTFSGVVVWEDGDAVYEYIGAQNEALSKAVSFINKSVLSERKDVL